MNVQITLDLEELKIILGILKKEESALSKQLEDLKAFKASISPLNLSPSNIKSDEFLGQKLIDDAIALAAQPALDLSSRTVDYIMTLVGNKFDRKFLENRIKTLGYEIDDRGVICKK